MLTEINIMISGTNDYVDAEMLRFILECRCELINEIGGEFILGRLATPSDVARNRNQHFVNLRKL